MLYYTNTSHYHDFTTHRYALVIDNKSWQCRHSVLSADANTSRLTSSLTPHLGMYCMFRGHCLSSLIASLSGTGIEIHWQKVGVLLRITHLL